jgi:hypothetical protein
MAKTQYCTATTIDGFIADRDNSLDWLFQAGPAGKEDRFSSFFAGGGAMAMGARLQRPCRWLDQWDSAISSMSALDDAWSSAASVSIWNAILCR